MKKIRNIYVQSYFMKYFNRNASTVPIPVQWCMETVYFAMPIPHIKDKQFQKILNQSTKNKD